MVGALTITSLWLIFNNALSRQLNSLEAQQFRAAHRHFYT